MGDVTLRIAGTDYAGWQAISVQRSIEQGAAQFDATVSDPTASGGTLDAWPIAPGAAVVVLVDGEPVLTGFVDKVAPRFDAGAHAVDVSGRSATADMVDASAIVEGGQFKNVTIVDVARRLAKPFGIAVDVSDVPADALDPFADVQIQQGESCYALIERLCRMQGVLACDAAGGIFRLARIGSRRADVTLRQGDNVQAATADLDVSQRFSEYIVKGQRANTDDRSDRPGTADLLPTEPPPAGRDDTGDGGGDGSDEPVDDTSDGGPAGESVRATRGSAHDSGITRYRPLLLIAECQTDDVSAQQRAEWEARRRIGKSLRATFVVAGWRQRGDAGPLWDVNLTVPIVAPWLGLDRDLVVASVEYRKDDNGTTTSLVVTLPDAFLPDDRKRAKHKKPKKTKGGAPGLADMWDAEVTTP